MAEKADFVPEGWYTIRDIAGQWGKSIPRTSCIVRDAIGLGIAESRDFRIIINGSPRKVPHYRFSAPAASPVPR